MRISDWSSDVCSSDLDSTLKHLTPASSAARISHACLPTPENTTLAGSAPIARTRASSPPETISKPAPRFLNSFRTAWLAFAFLLYHSSTSPLPLACLLLCTSSLTVLSLYPHFLLPISFPPL